MRTGLGFILLMLLSLILLVTSFAGGGLIISTLFDLSFYFSISIYACIFNIILALDAFLLDGDNSKK